MPWKGFRGKEVIAEAAGAEIRAEGAGCEPCPRGHPRASHGAWWGDARRERGDGRKDGGGICAPSLHVGRCEAGTELELRCPKLQLRSSVLQLHP